MEINSTDGANCGFYLTTPPLDPNHRLEPGLSDEEREVRSFAEPRRDERRQIGLTVHHLLRRDGTTEE